MSRNENTLCCSDAYSLHLHSLLPQTMYTVLRVLSLVAAPREFPDDAIYSAMPPFLHYQSVDDHDAMECSSAVSSISGDIKSRTVKMASTLTRQHQSQLPTSYSGEPVLLHVCFGFYLRPCSISDTTFGGILYIYTPILRSQS